MNGDIIIIYYHQFKNLVISHKIETSLTNPCHCWIIVGRDLPVIFIYKPIKVIFWSVLVSHIVHFTRMCKQQDNVESQCDWLTQRGIVPLWFCINSLYSLCLILCSIFLKELVNYEQLPEDVGHCFVTWVRVRLFFILCKNLWRSDFNHVTSAVLNCAWYDDAHWLSPCSPSRLISSTFTWITARTSQTPASSSWSTLAPSLTWVKPRSIQSHIMSSHKPALNRIKTKPFHLISNWKTAHPK